jgi:RNA polymerase sigma factor (sigma-70 family)
MDAYADAVGAPLLDEVAVEVRGVTFDELYRRDFPAVVGLVYALSGSRHAAEELAQDAFLAAHRSWARVGGYDDPGAWVRRVAVNRAVSALRRRSVEARGLLRLARQRPLPDPLPDEAEAFWRAARRLPARQAQAVALHYLEDRSVKDIATVLECAEATVRVHLHRGRQALALALELDAEEEA